METQRYALLSCYDKTDLADFAVRLYENHGLKIISTGGTYREISNAFCARGLEGTISDRNVLQVSDLTGFPEILDGRVKTLHPLIHGALLTDWSNPAHVLEAGKHGIPRIEVVAVNLYPFWTVDQSTSIEKAVELIDIGGVAMLRAAAKNHKHIKVYTSPEQYSEMPMPREMAQKAFELTRHYDSMIAGYLAGETIFTSREYRLEEKMKYGCNPHQTDGAGVYSIDGSPVPLKLLNGDWGYINVLDAVGCWGLVKELSEVTGRVAACSFKHTSPAGAAVYVEWDHLDEEVQILLSKLYGLHSSSNYMLNAYARARNGDPMSSFGDFIGLSRKVTAEVASFIAKQISDGIVAPGYTAEALEILKKKKKGKYVIVEADPNVSFAEDRLEFREMFGMALAQPANTRMITREDLGPNHIMCAPSEAILPCAPFEAILPSRVMLDMLVANTCLKYAQSNNVACAYQGQLVGLSAGQQSRVHSTRLACAKAEVWKRRHHPAAIAMLEHFRDDVKPQARINATTALAEEPSRFLEEYGNLLRPSSSSTVAYLMKAIEEQGNPFAPQLSLASDAFFPFPDSIHAAHRAGVVYIIQPGGSNRDDEVTDACSDHEMWMVHTDVRIFTH
jgi:phosphoribosylaminoimidazolecarboxamide formyltransferase/IMP cyclohydrolase